jgi:two-component system, chemotaxis family, protein-glutamate methylesterase/glutaminase
MANKDIIVIGGSAGSGPVLKRIMADLPADLPASIFVATHVPSRSAGYLAEMLSGLGPLPVSAAVDGQPIEKSRVYVAVPDRHLLLVNGMIALGEGPRENMARPAIDPLFRSAALAYGSRTIGVVLSGMLNDGASGLGAITARGGTALVQHPLDAVADAMPLAALETVAAADVFAAADLGGAIAAAAGSEAGPDLPAPESLLLEVRIAAGMRLGSEALRKIADPSTIVCPDCNGVMSEVRGEHPLRYRCQIGHARTAESLLTVNPQIDEAVRVAMRMMEERLTLVTRMAQEARDTGRPAVAELYQARADEYRGYAETLRGAAATTIRAAHVAAEEEA